MSVERETVLIIGAGLSGLYAGYLLQQQGYQVAILEARDRVGGRTLTENFVDLGGTWVSSKQPRIMRLCEQFGLTLYRQFEDGLNIAYIEHKRSTFTGRTVDAKITENKSSTSQYIDLFYQLTDTDSFMQQKHELDQISVYDWCLHNIADETARQLLCWSFQLLTCTDAREASMFFWLYFLKNCGGYRTLAGTRDAAQEFSIEEGAQAVSDHLAKHLNITFNAAATKIEHKEEGYTVHTSGHKIYSANKIISAIPAQLIPSIEWSPGLEPERQWLYQGMKMGRVTKIVCEYETAFWRSDGYSGKISCDTPPIALCYDACNQHHHALVIFIVDDKEYTDAAVLEHLAFLLDNPLAQKPQKIYRKNWSADPLSGGCYFAVPSLNHLAAHYPWLTKPMGNIYFVGTETANQWMGYMEGALESAERVVKQIIAS